MQDKLTIDSGQYMIAVKWPIQCIYGPFNSQQEATQWLVNNAESLGINIRFTQTLKWHKFTGDKNG